MRRRPTSFPFLERKSRGSSFASNEGGRRTQEQRGPRGTAGRCGVSQDSRPNAGAAGRELVRASRTTRGSRHEDRAITGALAHWVWLERADRAGKDLL